MAGVDLNALKIVHYPHPALRYPCRPVPLADRELRLQAGRMLELMYEAGGVGLAAPQVALPFQMLVLNFTADPNDRRTEGVYLNPAIVRRRGTQDGDEGCLSLPDLFGPVRRAKSVTVRAWTLDGNEVSVEADDLPARVWQHEIDHLAGVLFTDRMGPIAKLARAKEIRKFEQRFRKAQAAGSTPDDAALKADLRRLEEGLSVAVV